jgi:hypothetical protein
MGSGSSNIHVVRLRPESLGIEICLVPIDMVRPHEKSIEALRKYLRTRILEDGVIQDPVLADYRRGLIIDGTHRALVLRDLGMDYIPIQYIDYMDPGLRLYRWFRIFNGVGELPKGVLDRVAEVKEFEAGDLDRYPLYIVYNGRTYILLVDGGLEDIIRDIEVVEGEFLKLYKTHPSFLSEDEVLGNDEVLRSVDVAILGYRHVDKKEVLEAHKRGVLFHHKATRHVPPMRVLGINIPLDYLRTGNIYKAVEHLKRVCLEYVGEKVTLDGRYYAEKVYRGRLCEDKD